MTTAVNSQQECIQNCHDCQTTLGEMLTATCLAEGGAHVEQRHVKLMLDCMAACRTCVDFMSRNSDFHSHYCGACAAICQACADSCEKIGNMEACVESCRRCQRSCSSMSE